MRAKRVMQAGMILLLTSWMIFECWDGPEKSQYDPGAAQGDSAQAVSGNEPDGPSQEWTFSTDIVSELYAEEGTVKVSYDELAVYEVSYSYHIPQIDASSEGAAEINALIHDSYDGSVQKIHDALARNTGNCDPEWTEVSYQTYWYDDILSIIITAKSPYSFYPGYAAYHYDARSGERLSNEELLERYRIDASEFLTLARITAVRACDASYAPLLESLQTANARTEDVLYMYSSYVKLRRNTAQNQGLNADMPLFQDENGTFFVIVYVGAPTGEGFFYGAFPLELDAGLWEELKQVSVPEKYQIPAFYREIFLPYGNSGYETAAGQNPAQGSGNDDRYYIGLDRNSGEFVFRKSAGETAQTYKGSLQLVGIDENGYLFEYLFTSLNNGAVPDSGLKQGSFYFSPEWNYDPASNEGTGSALYRQHDGDDLLEGGNAVQRLICVY